MSLLTDKERERDAKRAAIAAALKDGWTYARIQAELGVSTTTISFVKRLMEAENGRDIQGV